MKENEFNKFDFYLKQKTYYAEEVVKGIIRQQFEYTVNKPSKTGEVAVHKMSQNELFLTQKVKQLEKALEESKLILKKPPIKSPKLNEEINSFC